jgi:hypothetical protein
MVQFNTKNLVRDGETIYYKTDNGNEFVARFKYNSWLATRFMKFLRSNVTVERYFEELKSGVAPLSIIKKRGFTL